MPLGHLCVKLPLPFPVFLAEQEILLVFSKAK